MFTAIVIGILKFFGLAIGAAIAAFLLNVFVVIARGTKSTLRLSKGYYLLGVLVSIAYHFVKWSL